MTWIDYGIRGGPGGAFSDPPPRFKVKEKKGDLLFMSLGLGGVFAFDVSDRKLAWSNLIGHFRVKGRTSQRLQFDEASGLLLVGGTDMTGPGGHRPVIDALQVRYANAAPNTKYRPAPIATLFTPWGARHLAIDPAGTGLLYTWDPEKGPIAVPISRPKFVFSGLYLGENEVEEAVPGAERPVPVEKITAGFLPLGAAMEARVAAEIENRFENDKKSTAAFKLRVALPGVFGDTLTAKVQSLRVLPEDSLLASPNLGAAVAPPGGPGWPDHEVVVELRRIGVGEDENNAAPGVVEGEGGRLGIAYNLYESVEKVLLIADPRAGRDYRRQKAGGPDQLADEESQCRRCEWPSYLPDPETTPAGDAELLAVKELLAGGPYLRAILWPDPAGDLAVRQKTEAAIAYFAEHQADYPAPAGVARILAPATPVASPFQASLAEPAQHPAMWSAGEAGVSVALTGGDLLVGGADHVADGRAMPFSFSRSYRSQSLGYGPLGSAGWHGNLFARLYENQVTGEVEYHDGGGSVWRFYRPDAKPGSDYEVDSAGSYLVAKGVYLRLQKLADGGWRLLGRHHDSAEFDAAGRLLRMSDRHRRGQDKDAQGNTVELGYDAFGQLATVTDDLGRRYRFEYYEDPRPVSQGGDGPRFGLLKKLEDFAERTVEYEFDEERRLTKVKMPEVKNPIDDYQAEYSFEGSKRPTLEYRYGKEPLVDEVMTETRAILHGDFAQLRLSEIVLPAFTGDATPAPRAIFSYAKDTGRLEKVSFPKADGSNSAAGGVVWELESTGFELPAGPAEQIEIKAPWGHEVRYRLDKGRTQEVEQTLAVVQPADGALLDETVKTTFEYAEDGRLKVVDSPDGGQLINCYSDAKNEAGQLCPVTAGPPPQVNNLPGEPSGPPPVDRLALANVVKVIQKATTEAGKGAADYDSLDAQASYEGDNLVASITDGLSRGIQMPVPQANAESRSAFQAEGIGGKFEHDAFGRVKNAKAGTANPYEVSVQFKADAQGKKDAGLPERVKKGAGQLWQAFEYDPQNNLKRFKNSQGAESLADYDLWDRLVRSKEGLADGRLAPVGNGNCGIEAKGAVTERAFDAAGHLARERRLQDYIDAEGSLQCRWVESSYTYNQREQLVEVAQTHLANPLQPGQVDAASLVVMRLEYDEHGRMLRHVSLNQADPHVETLFDYDAAGRVKSVKVGDSAAQTRAYDRKSRVVKTTDGDEAVWRGRYDVWDRLYLSQSPAGAFTKNVFDRAGHLTETVTTDRDPFGSESGEAQLLAKTKSHFTSFSEPDKVVEILVDEETGQRQILITRREFDDAGRVKALWSGPAQETAEEIDPQQKRRESETVYESGTGRVLEQWRGGYAGQPPLIKQKFYYETENASSWPDRMAFFEAVPGQPDLVETASARYRRDALGRVIEEKRNDGSLVATTYDRSSNSVLQVRTGADSLTRASYDGAGRQIRVIRPNDRGETLYARDLDGRLTEQVVKRSGEDWVTTYDYDRTGRPIKTNYHDGSFAETTYNPDNTVATQRSREGVLVSVSYDAANRPLSQVPSLAAGADTSYLVALDPGNYAGYDKLSRPTTLSRGSAGGTSADAELTVAYPIYDLGSRPGSEVVGARGPMSWQYDVYSRREQVFLPTGPGRDQNGTFEGWSRQFDTLDRMTDVSGIGSLSTTTPGATWSRGGGHLYGMSTKGTLGTSLRLGYLGGEGPQLPGGAVSSDSKWKLGTLTWGAGGTSATEVPTTTWGQFGFGYRGSEGDPRDGAKIGREVMAGQGFDLFAGQGWSWDYDAGVRLSAAWSGRGDLQGGEPEGQDGFRYEYGKGDELERVVDESAGTVANTETGAYGRIVSRGGAPFTYDQSGRRAEDDRFVYLWNWRSELMQVTVKESWSNGEATPFAGHQVRYAYDAMGRLHARSHFGALPEGVTDQDQRPLVEKRVFVWEGQSLLAEAGYGDVAETQLRWRKTYVPGPGGLDDAVQVVVENLAFPAQGKKLYTYLRDELGTVLGVVSEEESQDPAKPTIPARYHYTPYGEGHAEIGPELRRVRFDAGVLTVAGVEQAAATPLTANGALRLSFSIPVDPATIAAGLTFEERTPSGWQAVSGAEMLAASEGEDRLDLLVSLRSAWKRNTSYRVRADAGFKDQTGRVLATEREIEFTIPAAATVTTTPVDHRFPIDYESWRTAGDTLGGRFPGGQTSLFQGLWTDPVTGVNFARTRWYDPRNAVWLCEDPLLTIDSPNLYAFVGWQPSIQVDPLGTCVGPLSQTGFCQGLNASMTPDSSVDPSETHVKKAMDDAKRSALEKNKREAIKVKAGQVLSPRVQHKFIPNIIREPLTQPITGLIIHETGGDDRFGTFNHWATDPKHNGAHFLIERDGQIFQTVPVDRKANHAGLTKSRCLVQVTYCAPFGQEMNQFHKDFAKWKNAGGIANRAGLNESEKAKSYRYRYPINSDSLGIELVGASRDPLSGKGAYWAADAKYDEFTPEQQEALTWLVGQLRELYGIREDMVLKHNVTGVKAFSEAWSADWGSTLTDPDIEVGMDIEIVGGACRRRLPDGSYVGCPK